MIFETETASITLCLIYFLWSYLSVSDLNRFGKVAGSLACCYSSST